MDRAALGRVAEHLVKLARTEGAIRCGLCGGDLADGATACADCHAPYHTSCWKSVGGCSAAPCAGVPGPSPVALEIGSSPRRRARLAPWVGATLVVASLCLATVAHWFRDLAGKTRALSQLRCQIHRLECERDRLSKELSILRQANVARTSPGRVLPPPPDRVGPSRQAYVPPWPGMEMRQIAAAAFDQSRSRWSAVGPAYEGNPDVGRMGATRLHAYGRPHGRLVYWFHAPKFPIDTAHVSARLSSEFAGWSGPKDGHSDVTLLVNDRDCGTIRVIPDDGAGKLYTWKVPGDALRRGENNSLAFAVLQTAERANGVAIYDQTLGGPHTTDPITVIIWSGHRPKSR